MVDQKWIDFYPQWYGPNAKDPDEGQGDVEVDDYISRLMAKFTGIGGAFSTWKERHAFIIGAEIGYLHVNKTEIIPVPDFFVKENHYFYSGMIMGRATSKLEAAAPSLKTYLAIFAAGGVSVTAILKFFGIGG